LAVPEIDTKPNETERYGRYEVVRRLASGGMGEVYLAKSIGAAGFQKHVVIKKILPHLTEHPQTVKSLVREAKLLVLLNHPNIVQVFDLGVEGTDYFMAMEYVHGYNLSTILHYCSKKKISIPPDVCAFIGNQVLGALSYAHELRGPDGARQNIIHRDVSPQNVMISYSGQVKLTDFGIAKVLSEAEDEHTQSLKGKWRYMAPEALDGGRIDQRYDLFAVGILLFESLCRRNLFSGKRDVDILNQVREARVPDIARYSPEAPPALIEVTQKALAKNPTHRFPTARELSQALVESIKPTSESQSAEHLRDFVSQIYDSADFPLNKPKIVDPNAADPDATRSLVLKSRLSEAPLDIGRPSRRGGTAIALLSLGLVAISGVVAYIAYTVLIKAPSNGGGEPARIIVVKQDAAPAPEPAPRAPDLAVATAPSKPDAGRRVVPRRPAIKFTESVGREAFNKKFRRLLRCFEKHKDTVNDLKAFKIKSKILRSGRVSGVQIDPASIAATPFGTCVVRVARAVRYPRHDQDYVNFTLPVKLGQ
jgi:serine/threonine-protein kinase